MAHIVPFGACTKMEKYETIPTSAGASGTKKQGTLRAKESDDNPANYFQGQTMEQDTTLTPANTPKRAAKQSKSIPDAVKSNPDLLKDERSKVDVSQAIDLKYNHHLSYAQIAKIQGCTPQAIHNRIKDMLPIPETQVFIDHRGDILANLQMKLLSHVDDERLKKAPAGSLVLAACQLYDKERLERGQSTEITDIRSLSATIHTDLPELYKMRDELRAAKGQSGGNEIPEAEIVPGTCSNMADNVRRDIK